MNLKNFLFMISIIFFIKALPMVSPYNKGQLPPPPTAEEIEEVMKSPEFQKMMKELEKVFEEIDDEDDLTPTKKEVIKPPKIGKIKPLPETKTTEKPKTKKENFLENAIPQDIKDASGKIVKKLSKEKIESFNYYINKFIRTIVNIEKKVNSFALGIAFKELLEQQGFFEDINKIVISVNLIKSKRLYQKIFFLPVNNELRKSILIALDSSKKLLKEISNQAIEDAKEKETIDFLKKAAESKVIKKTDLKKIKLSPIQEKIQSLFKSNIKPISVKIGTVAINVQAKEEIEKKKKTREELEKKIAEQQRRSPQYRQDSRYPSYSGSKYGTPGWGSYGQKGGAYSGPSRGYGGYYNGASPYSAYKPKKEDKTKNTTDSSKPKKSSGQSPSRQIPEKTVEQLNRIKSLIKENTELLNKIKAKYNPNEEEKSFKEIYKSKDLQKIAKNFDEIRELERSLDPQTRKKIAQESNFLKTMDQFTPIGIRLAKHPLLKEQRSIASKLLEELSPLGIKKELKKYEDEQIKKLQNKETLLTSLTTSPDEIDEITRNLEIINTQPFADEANVEKVNKQFEEQYRLAEQIRENFATRTINDLTENIGQQVPIREVGGQEVGGAMIIRPEQAGEAAGAAPQLATGRDIIAAVTQTNLSDEVKNAFQKKIQTAIGENQLAQILNDQQKEKIKKVMNELSDEIKNQKKALEKIRSLFEGIRSRED
jgi:hypothetical protein